MYFFQCDIKAVRNLSSLSLALSPGFNVFFGQNGSGKTSILESLYLLAHNRSFRHHSISPVICHQADSLFVFSRLNSQENVRTVGMEKTREGKTTLHLDGVSVASAAAIAEIIPLQLIHPDSDELLTGSPRLRRQFMDWGVFHVEHSFLNIWQRWQRALKQRNAALKLGDARDHVFAWSGEFVETSERISDLREHYLQRLSGIFGLIVKDFLPDFDVQLLYQRGWSQESSLGDLLERNYFRDVQLKHTYYGPHRDELVVMCGGNRASEMLSRGEQKLVVIALRLAQGQLLKEIKGESSIYLLDDFAAELDAVHRRCVIERLLDFKAQVFLTTIDYEEVKSCVNFVEPKLFHVEHGRVIEV